ncbi:MAG: hypothetical protein Q8905_10985 [Bacteroidota bacterium]|nr:hypothetical protein [Bacteroidota bacterium]
MMTIKKIISYFLVVVILLFTVIALLGVWGIIPLENIMGKLMSSLLIILAASAVILFIFSVLIKSPEEKEK